MSAAIPTTPETRPKRRGIVSVLRETPLWILSGEFAILSGIAVGFGAFSVPPKGFLLLNLMSIAGIVLFGPVRNIKKLIVSIPVLLFLGWWALSYVWTWNDWVYLRDTQLAFPFIASLILAMGLIPKRLAIRSLVNSCYIAIGYSLLWTAAYPGLGTRHSDGNSGWPMSFGHKNGMAPFMLFAVLTFLAFEERPWRRRTGVVVCVTLIMLSQSMTTVMAGLLLLPFGWFIRTVVRTPKESRGLVMGFGSLLGIGASILATNALPAIIGTAGKDLTLTSRTEIWANAFEVIGREPWFGYGKGGVWIVLGAEPTRTLLDGLGFVIYEAHNGYIEVVLQLGIIGLILFVAMMIGAVRSSLSIADLHPAVAWYVTMFVAFMAVTSITESTTFYYLPFLAAFYTLVLRIARDDEHPAWTS